MANARPGNTVGTLDSVEPVPVLHSVLERVKSSPTHELPSTVDMDALKQEPMFPGVLEAASLAWRSTVAPKPRPKVLVDSIGKRDLHHNGMDRMNQSEESQASGQDSSSDSDDSGSDSDSASTSSSSSSSSSGSSNSSDSETDSMSNRSSSCHSASKRRLNSSKLSASNSSTSSRSRKSKSQKFSVSQNYEPGSLKLKIAALKLPTQSMEYEFEQPTQVGRSGSKTAIGASAGASTEDRASCDTTTVKRDRNSTKRSPSSSSSEKLTDEKNNPMLRRSSRSRTKCSGEKEPVSSSSVVQNGSVRPRARSEQVEKSLNTNSTNGYKHSRSESPASTKNTAAERLPGMVQNARSETALRSGSSSMNQVSENGISINHGMPKKEELGSAMPLSSTSVSDSVLLLAKNCDLTIFPITPSLATNGDQSNRLVTHQSISKRDLTITAATTSGTSSAALLSPMRASKRLSSQNRKSAEVSEAASYSILSVPQNAASLPLATTSKSAPTLSSSQYSPSRKSSTSYKSHLLEKFQGIISHRGSLPPQIGDVSIEPIIPKDVSVKNCSSNTAITHAYTPDTFAKSTNLQDGDTFIYRDQKTESRRKKAYHGTTLSIIHADDDSSQSDSTSPVKEIKLSKSAVRKLNGKLPILSSGKCKQSKLDRNTANSPTTQSTLMEHNTHSPHNKTRQSVSEKSPAAIAQSIITTDAGSSEAISMKTRKSGRSPRQIVDSKVDKIDCISQLENGPRSGKSLPSDLLPLGPVKTKAAKKYIPDSVDAIVPRIGTGIVKSKSSRKKKSKKSKAKSKLPPKVLEDFEKLCEEIQAYRIDDDLAKKKSPKKHGKRESGVFVKTIFRAKPTPLIPLDMIPLPPPDVWRRKLSEVKGGTHSNGYLATSSRKRKAVSSASSTSSKEKDSGSDVSFTENSGTEVQKLPLKKRHHLASPSAKVVDKPNFVNFLEKKKEESVRRLSLDCALPPVLVPVSNVTESNFVTLGRKSKGFADLLNSRTPPGKSAPASPGDEEQKVIEHRRSKRVRKSIIESTDMRKSPNGAQLTENLAEVSDTGEKPSPRKLEAGTSGYCTDSSSGKILIPRPNFEGLRKRSASPSELMVNKRIKTELELMESEALQIYDAIDFKVEPEEISNDGSLTVPATLSTTTVTTSASSPIQPSKRRRRTNKTGFPVARKKKRRSTMFQSINGILTPQSSGLDESGLSSQGDLANDCLSDYCNSTLGSIAKTESDVSVNGEDVKADIDAIEAEQFSSSLTERVKMRKRKSIDGYLSQVLSGEIVIPGVIPPLLTVEDPPNNLPLKVNYLNAGLLSNAFKGRFKGKEYQKVVKPYFVDDNGFPKTSRILPPPEYAEKWLRDEYLYDYELPYDIWCAAVIHSRNCYENWKEQEEAKLNAMKQEGPKSRRKSQSQTKVVSKPPKEKVTIPSWKFKKIRQNQYYYKPNVDAEEMSCSCQEGPLKCSGEDCLNRVVYTECQPQCGDNCRNRRIQKHEDSMSSLTRFMTENKGYGIRAKEPLRRGDFILEYVGEVVPDAIFKERMHTIYAEDTHHYCLQLDSGLVIDGHRVGGECRFVNHSCQPNCEMQKWSVNGLSRMALFALRNIEAGEELSYDYNFSLYNPAEGQPCHCGSENCRGVIGVRKQTRTDAAADSKRKKQKALNANGMNRLLTWKHDQRANQIKVLSTRERKAVRKYQVFLIRNHEKLRTLRGMGSLESFVGDRLEKLMLSWVSRFKAGSSHNKPLFLNHGEDPEFAELAKMAQIFYELWATLVSAKDEKGQSICEPFMTLPPLSKSQLQDVFGKEPLDLTQVSKRIMRGCYTSLAMLETDIGTVLKCLSQYLETDKPAIEDTIDKIKIVYSQAKAKAIASLEPFIININDLTNFAPFDPTAFEDGIIRCICGTYSEEGTMVQCEKCKVWQHVDCMRVKGVENHQIDNSKRKSKKSKSEKTKLNSPRSKSVYSGNQTEEKVLSPIKSKPEQEKVEFEDQDIVIGTNEAITVLNISNEVSFNEMETQQIDSDFLPVESENGYGVDNLISSDLGRKDTVEKSETKVLPDAPSNAESYFCERCLPREMDLNIPISAQTDPSGNRHYLTLVREDGFIARKNDTVYVLRKPLEIEQSQNEDEQLEDDTFVSVNESLEPSLGPHQNVTQPTLRSEVTYKTAGNVDVKNCDIFRIQDLWITPDGNKVVFGHNYLRPDETFHEPNRKFYPNEILRSPLTEIIPIDAIYRRCWVLDSATFARGRPVGTEEEHVYICDMRVDKKARSFARIGKNNPKISTEAYAFRYFQNKLKIQRNFHPHGPPAPDFKPKSYMSVVQEKARVKKMEDKIKMRGKRPAMNLDAKERKVKADLVNRVLLNLQARIPSFYTNPTDASDLLLRDRKSKGIGTT